MKNNMFRKVTATVLGIGILSMGATALAGTTYSSYNTTVGAFNGSGYTGYQTKATAGTNGNLNSTSVGGGYEVDARMQDATSGVHGPWARDVVVHQPMFSIAMRAMQQEIACGYSFLMI